MKKIIRCLIIIVLIPLLVSCRDTDIYRGNDPELHSVALESIVGTRSYEMNEVLRIEEDSYGKVLFAFFGTNLYWTFNGREDILAIVIAQKTVGDFAYYYDSVNVMAVSVDQLNESLTLDLLESYFDEEDIEELKVKNDWNKPINDKLLFETKVTRKKTCEVQDRELRPYEDSLKGVLHPGFVQCYGKDRNGYMLVSVVSKTSNHSSRTFSVNLMIVNQDHELISPDAVMRVTDIFDMEAIKRFKEVNGWSFESQDGS
jgi:hypothetical protein